MTTPMNLVLPTPGPPPTGTTGPLYAQMINTALTKVENHNHTSGKGLQVPTAGLGINADLPFAGFQATGLKGTQYDGQTAPLASGYQRVAYASTAGDLWWNNGSGQGVRITNGNTLNLSSVGGITGMTGSASVVFASGSASYSFYSATSVYAALVGAAMQVRNAGGFGWNWRADPAQGTASYTWYFDTATTPPSSDLPLTMTAVSGGTSKLKAAQIVTAQIADSNVTTAKIADSNVTSAKIADGNVTLVKVAAAAYANAGGGGSADKLIQANGSGLVALSFLVATTTWTAITSMGTNWTAGPDLAFFRDSFGIVYLRGSVSTAGSGGTTVFTLPGGAGNPWPAQQRGGVFVDPNTPAMIGVTVNADGTVHLLGSFGSGALTFLCDDVSFSV